MQNKYLFAILFFLFVYTSYSQVHTSYLWHLQQPIYWPEQSIWDPYDYQPVWESQYLKDHNGNWYSDGQQHPLNNLEDIFNKDDRKAVYQWRTKDAVQSLLGFPEAGAQVSYSGCLLENVNSLAAAGQWGYSNGWQNNYITARSWQTSGGNPRMDLVGFTMHHALAPLLSDEVLHKQIQAHRYIYEQNFGSNPDYSKGFWPAECSFSERIIQTLVEEGFEWSVIANSHLARTLQDYPLNFGTSGCNIDPPNYADVTTFTGDNWWSGQIDGRGGSFAAPFCYQAHRAQYVDPVTGMEYHITIVPMADLLSYQNGYALMGTGDIDTHIAPFDDPAQPSIVLLAHDGDNAWGGGYDYYNNSVPGFAADAAAHGYIPSTVQQFLDDHPVPSSDIVHVEDGSWFNAANDWGHPQFINWLWPMYDGNFNFDPNGWTEDARNWAVLVAAENRVVTAEELSGGTDVSDIVNPGASANLAERAWHHLLPAYTSGYMYYGTSLDMEVKQSLACNLACNFADQEINSHPGVDDTPPTVFIPQRYPYNPGGIGFGPTYGYQQHQNSSDFTVWTFAYDVSGISSMTLKYRTDGDGINPLTDNDNETYNGGPGVHEWHSIAMTERIFPTGNVSGNPEIDFFILPDYIANQYHAEITGLSDTLVDYYVEATDIYGNTFKSPIQHVYVGTYTPGGGGNDYNVSWTPQDPDENDAITIVITDPPTTGKLHWGVNFQGSNWQSPDPVYWPSGSYLFNGSGPAVETPMIFNAEENTLSLQLGPFNNPVQTIQSVAFVIHFDDDSWDNNNGNDYHITIEGNGGGITGIVWEPQNPNQLDSIKIFVGQASQGAHLHWGMQSDGNYWQSPDPVYWPPGSYLFNGTGPAIETPFNGPDQDNVLELTLFPFNQSEQQVDGVDFVIHYNDDSWDNNNGSDYHISISTISSIEFDLKVFLEGPFAENQMAASLYLNELIPLDQPYFAEPWNYEGEESVGLIPDSQIVDWILLDVRNAITPEEALLSEPLARKACFILADGSIVDINGTSLPAFGTEVIDNITQNIFILLWHRNHVGIISAHAISQDNGIYEYNYTIGQDQAFNSMQKQLQNGSWSMFGGDTNADGIIDSNDLIIWEVESGESMYSPADLNLDGQINNSDKNDVWQPNQQ